MTLTGPRKNTSTRAAALLVLAAALCAGCKPRIAYNLDPIPDYVYECKSYSGGLNEKGEPSYTDIAGDVIHIKVSPLSKVAQDAGDVKVTILTEDEKPNVFGGKNFGAARIRLGGNGAFTVTTSSGMVRGLTDIFFETPKKRLRAGDSWSAVRYQDESFYMYNHKFEFQNPVEYKYTYAGKTEVGGKSCARIKVVGSHSESIDIPTPEGASTFTTSLTKTGDVCFDLNPGRVRQATYEQIIRFNAKDTYTGELLVEINNMTRKVYKLIKP